MLLEELCCCVDAQPTRISARIGVVQDVGWSLWVENIVLSLLFMLLQALPRAEDPLPAMLYRSKTRTRLLLYCARSLATWSIKPLKSSQRLFLLLAGFLSVALIFASAGSAAESDTAEGDSQEEVIERILELREQIEALLDSLPDDVRQQVEKRWQERLSEQPESTPDESQQMQMIEPVPESRSSAEATTEAQVATEIATETVEDPVVENALPEGKLAVAESQTELAATPPPCGGFHRFDTNEDALISAGDRQWRFLRLWFDTNGDEVVEESEIESLFELGIRMIDVNLKFYVNDKGDSEDVDVDDQIWLRMIGKTGEKQRSGALTVAADRLVRDGRLWLTDADRVQLTGLQALRPEDFLETKNGERYPLVCSGESPST